MAAFIDALSTLERMFKVFIFPDSAVHFQSHVHESTIASSSVHPEYFSIHYLYDPVPHVPAYLCPRARRSISGALHTNPHLRLNSILVDPLAANFPYRSSLALNRASKYSKVVFDETRHLLEVLAANPTALDIEVDHGITLARLAKKELRPGIEDRMMGATIHMFPGADEERIRHIACFILLYFIFDGG